MKTNVSTINIISTSTDKDPIAWRQWHHWNVMTNIAEVELPKGVSVLTLHIVTEGNMNLAYLDFESKHKWPSGDEKNGLSDQLAIAKPVALRHPKRHS